MADVCIPSCASVSSEIIRSSNIVKSNIEQWGGEKENRL